MKILNLSGYVDEEFISNLKERYDIKDVVNVSCNVSIFDTTSPCIEEQVEECLKGLISKGERIILLPPNFSYTAIKVYEKIREITGISPIVPEIKLLNKKIMLN